MKKEIYPNEALRKKRFKKKNKRNKPLYLNKTNKVRREKVNKARVSEGLIPLVDSFLGDELHPLNNKKKKISLKNNIKISIPAKFDIFKNTEGVISSVIDIAHKIMSPNLKQINIDHRKVKETSLGSESLLGLLVTEIIKNRRSKRGEKISIHGRLALAGKKSRSLIENVGLVKELSGGDFQGAQEHDHENRMHIYGKDNRYAIKTSIKGDNKSITAQEFVNYLSECLKSHKLKLSVIYESKLKACLGEVFDNVEEHCGRNKPVWFVRGYFNDVERERSLELCVFNLGNSFFDNFNVLPDSSKIKNKALEYVNRHKKMVDPKSLFTVASLQGSISTKSDSDPTRGHGTVTLIETFEAIYDGYKKLRGNGVGGKNAEMNIISGETIIKFDGRYRSKIDEIEGGSEKFVMPFNAKQSLDEPPEDKYVYTMTNVKFPGVMINIRMPLYGSTVPLSGDSYE